MKPIRESLQNTVRAYFESVDLCLKGRAYWALLHVLVVFPDICSAMEHADGEATSGSYEKWSKRFLCDPVMKPEDWYRLRCLLLHQGRTRNDRGSSQYDYVRFSHPQEGAISTLHRRVQAGAGGQLIHLDVRALANEMCGAIQNGFSGLRMRRLRPSRTI